MQKGNYKEIIRQKNRVIDNVGKSLLSVNDELHKAQPKIRLANEVVARFIDTTDPIIKKFINDAMVAADAELEITVK